MLSLSAFYLLPVFLLLYLLLSTRGHFLAAEAAPRGLTWAYLLPLLSRRHAKCCLYTHFLTTRSRGSVFCCSWTALSKSLHSVCLRRTSDENSNRFFPTRSASSGVVSGLSLRPPDSSLQHQILHFQGWEGGREIESNTTNWTFDRWGKWEAGECKWALHYHRPLELSYMFSGFLKALIWPKSSFL